MSPPFHPFDPDAEKQVYWRRLPHWSQAATTHFLTWRLHDSLPEEKVRELHAERQRWLVQRGLSDVAELARLPEKEQREFHDYFTEKMQAWLDAGYGECWLARPEVSAAVAAALGFFDGKRYALGEFVVMPNHVHLLVTPAPEHELKKIVHSWKSYSAKEVNKLAGRTGQVWMDESFDHIVRSEAHLARYESYIRGNPVKAGVVPGSFRAGRGGGLEAPRTTEGGLEAGLTSEGGLEARRTTLGRLEACLTKLKLRHFRCFEAFETEFARGMNFIVGPNARGKTSLLEAACVLLRLQSPRVTRLAHVIQHERRGLAVDGYFESSAAARHLQFYFSRERKKLALDEVEQKSAAEYLQVGRVIYFANSDIELVRGTGEVRRRFLDFVAAQREPGYRAALRNYERAMRSRNLLLKAGAPRWREIAAFDEPLLAAGRSLAEARQRLIGELQAPAASAHAAISGGSETLRLEYVSGSGGDFAASLAAAQKEDARLRQTSAGPHRDDVRFFIGEQPSDFASEGQQRTLVLALKLGAARLLESHFGAPPVLLLDDIFGELDPARRNALLAALPAESQKIITTTHLKWMPGAEEQRVLRLG